MNGNTKEYATKFDNLLKKFLADQGARSNLNLTDINISTFSGIFEQFKPEAKQAQMLKDKQRLADQKQKEADAQKAKEAAHAAAEKILKKPQNLKHYSLEQFIDEVLVAFSDASKSNFNDLDHEIQDHLHQIFKVQLGIGKLQS